MEGAFSIALNIAIPVSGNTGLLSADMRLSSPDVTISYFLGKRDFEELLKSRPTTSQIDVRVGLSLDESSEPVSNIVFRTPL